MEKHYPDEEGWVTKTAFEIVRSLRRKGVKGKPEDGNKEQSSAGILCLGHQKARSLDQKREKKRESLPGEVKHLHALCCENNL